MGADVSAFSAQTVKMKLLPFFYSLSTAKKDICLGSGDNPLDSNETPSYGGTCWDNWETLQEVQDWAKDNCGGVTGECENANLPDEKCFANPFEDIEVDFSYDGYNEWVKDNHPGDLTDLDGCEDLLKSYDQWFDPDVFGEDMDCNFKMKMNYPQDGSSQPNPTSQVTSFFEGAMDEGEKCGSGSTGRYDLQDCYCNLPESSKWIKISSYISETHPTNPKTEWNENTRSKRDVETFNDELGTEISELGTSTSNTYRVLKLTKNHANRNYWRMDCLYCTLMTKAQNSSTATYFFEYVLDSYNQYVQKLMHKTCAVHFEQEMIDAIEREFDCLRASLETDPNFCNGDNELCFEQQKDCDAPICSDGVEPPLNELPDDCPAAF